MIHFVKNEALLCVKSEGKNKCPLIYTSYRVPRIYSRGQKKVGQCFFDNVNLLALSRVTMKIFIYLL
jgi:hypothetical protein